MGETVEMKPVAWRYRYERGDGKVHWTLTQREVRSQPAAPGLCEIVAEPLYASPPPTVDGETFQARVQPWMLACFGAEIAADREERGDRLLEEVFELLQSGGYDPARVLPLRNYVWNRPAGEPRQEMGGVMVTAAAYALAHGLDMHEAGEAELARIWTKVDAIRAKQAAKPTGSALPVAAPERPRAKLWGSSTTISDAPGAQLSKNPGELPSAPDTEELVERLNRWTAQLRDQKTATCPADYEDRCEFAHDVAQAAKLLEERTRELEEARDGESRWLLRVSAIREASGLGAKPMLDELPGEIAKIADRARLVDELVEGLEQAMDSRAPDYADAAHPGWHDRARSLLSRARERKG